MHADVLKEFLVRVGFKTDDASLSKLNRQISDAGKAVAKFAAIAAGAATAVGIGVKRFAEHMEQLHFSSQRSNTTVRGIKAIEYAARQLGASSESALEAVEGIARFMRDKPGGEAWLKGFIETRDAAGNLRDTKEMLLDLGDVMEKLPYQSKVIGDMLGFGENFRLAIQNGDFRKYVREREKLAGNDEEAAKKAHQLQEKLRELSERFQSLAMIIGDRLLTFIGPRLEAFMTWMETHGDSIGDSMERGLKSLLTFADQAIPTMQRVSRVIDDLVTKFENIGPSIEKTAKQLRSELLRPFAKFYAAIGIQGAQDWLTEDSRDQRTSSGKIGPRPAPGGRPVPMTVDKAAAVVEFFQRMGWTLNQAAGIAANLKNESAFNPRAENAGHYGLAQWDQTRQANFEKWSGKNIRQSSIYDQLRFIHYELSEGAERAAGYALQAARTPLVASDVMFRLYERAGDHTGPRRGRDAVQIAQNVTINVDGGGSAGSVGRAVSGQMSNQSNELARLLGRTLDAAPGY